MFTVTLFINIQKLEANQMHFNRGMDTESGTFTRLEYCLAIKNGNITNFVGKWIEVENIILREVTQTQKDIHGMYSLKSGHLHQISENLQYNSKYDKREDQRMVA